MAHNQNQNFIRRARARARALISRLTGSLFFAFLASLARCSPQSRFPVHKIKTSGEPGKSRSRKDRSTFKETQLRLFDPIYPRDLSPRFIAPSSIHQPPGRTRGTILPRILHLSLYSRTADVTIARVPSRARTIRASHCGPRGAKWRGGRGNL